MVEVASVKSNQDGWSPQSIIAFSNELRTAIGLLKFGLHTLKEIDMANDFYHLPLLLLASGLERLSKCVLVLQYRVSNGSFPPHTWLKELGHNLEKLIDEIVKRCYPEETNQPQALKEDRSFIASDPIARKLIEILTQFGSGGRYHDLDTICGEALGEQPPEQKWQELEMEIVQNDSVLKTLLGRPSMGNVLYREINRRIQITIERLVRALCRLFSLGSLSHQGRQLSVMLTDFLYLKDKDLGTRSCWL